MLKALFNIIIFPGILFLGLYSWFFAYADRKLQAKLQNRRGPGWYQPLADLCKLLGKEAAAPNRKDKAIFNLLPVIALAVTTAAYLYIPMWAAASLHPFNGDLIVTMYFLLVPTLCFFLAGWYSSTAVASISATRAILQMLAYEVPLFISVMAPGLLADSLSFAGIHAYYSEHPMYMLINLPALVVSIAAVQGRLERSPFDLSNAEVELNGGILSGYGGRYLAMFCLVRSSEAVVICSLLAAVFFPFYSSVPFLSFLIYLLKTLLLWLIFVLFRNAFARMRMNQLIMFYWKILTPLALIQVIANLLLKGVLN